MTLILQQRSRLARRVVPLRVSEVWGERSVCLGGKKVRQVLMHFVPQFVASIPLEGVPVYFVHFRIGENAKYKKLL